VATTEDRASHHYVITTTDGMGCGFIHASVVKETKEAKMVEL
jgi:hypothetical protein